MASGSKSRNRTSPSAVARLSVTLEVIRTVCTTNKQFSALVYSSNRRYKPENQSEDVVVIEEMTCHEINHDGLEETSSMSERL